MQATVQEKKTKQRIKKEYEKPFIKKEESMNFPRELIEAHMGGRIICKQCSSCHSCR